MKSSRRKPVQRYHDRVAHRYDDIYDDAYWRWHDTLTWDYLKPHLPASLGDPIIDLGCGTGKWGLRIAQSGYRVTCVDISIKMVETVRGKVEELGLADRVTCRQADLINLSALPAEHFALAIALGEPLCSADPPARAMKEIRRILKPGGRLIATFDNSLNALEHYLEKGQVDNLDRFLRDGKTNWITQDHGERFELQTFTPRQLAKLFAAARFEVLEMLGKTVLPMRRYRELLDDKTACRKLLQIEKKLARDPDALGRAAHVQVAAVKIS